MGEGGRKGETCGESGTRNISSQVHDGAEQIGLGPACRQKFKYLPNHCMCSLFKVEPPAATCEPPTFQTKLGQVIFNAYATRVQVGHVVNHKTLFFTPT